MTPAAFWGAAYLPPVSSQALLIDQFVSALGYMLIALFLAWLRRSTKSFDMAGIARAAVAGARLPPTLTLAVIPFFPDVLPLFSETTMQTYLMLAGVILSALSIYGLIK